MFELTDISPSLDILESEYLRLLGYPRQHVLEGRPLELAARARKWYAMNGRPWIYAREIHGLELRDGRLRLQEIEFESRPLYSRLAAAGAHAAVVAAVSAGPQCEAEARRHWQAGEPDEYFFLEMYGSAVVEHLVTLAGGRLCAWAEPQGMTVLPHYSPGYSGWDIGDQIKLWDLIRRNGDQALPGELEVLSTGMLRPKKSLLALFGLTRQVETTHSLQHLVPCETCSLPGCPYRRAPYQQSPPQIEDVHRLQGVRQESPATILSPSGLDHQAKYSTNVRALQKWSRNRLRLERLADGAVEAWFHYEGTTCVNLGRPLEFYYQVKLASPAEQYRIIEANCAPAPGDTGHQSMCEYLANARALMDNLAIEKPLLGRPLNDVLTWDRPVSPSGCYCDRDKRLHKWGLVFEVIHYALAQLEPEHPDGQPATKME
ncbi:MAG TPA: hypothetical protein VMB80_10800 [Candidatus Acidoferrum sp.]|nr:hypothetical protein [Candidatus Acidoferrum sp.]